MVNGVILECPCSFKNSYFFAAVASQMSMDDPTSYNLSFTAASLRPELARIVAECYLAEGDWDLVKNRILITNALQSRSVSSAVRVERELRQRLATLTHDQIVLLAKATAEDRAAMAWLATFKHNAFVFDFAAELLRDKLAAHDPILRHSDYETFIDNRSASHPELARLTNSSRNKIRQVLLRMLAEAGLLGPGAGLGTIQRPVLSPAVLSVVISESPRLLAGFLVPDTEIGGM
jgi:hypothetical protein